MNTANQEIKLHGHYSMTGKENQMKDLLELYNKMHELRDDVRIENTTQNPFVDAYNQGVDAMVGKIMYVLNNSALKKAFGGEQNG